MEVAFLLGSFVLLLLLGVHVGTAMLFASILNIVTLGFPPIIAPERLLSSLNSFPLLAVPFFMFAGVIMNRAGLTERLVDLSRAFVGHFYGGTAQVNVLASIFFSGISGSASADAAAIGSVLIPTMKREGYPAGFAVGITAASATIGPIVPPSIVMVIYGAMTNMSIGTLFVAGIIPGLAIGLVLMGMVAVMSWRQNFPRQAKAPWRVRLRALRSALPALLAPIIIVGGIMTGVFTATEAGVVACLYGLGVGFFVYKELKFLDVRQVLLESVEMTAIPLYILATASIFGWLLTYHGLGRMLAEFLGQLGLGQLPLLFVITALLLVVGLLVEGLAALIIFVPVFLPIVSAFGINELHFALIMIITILIGTVTPPVGLQLYIASAIGKTPISQVTIWPFVLSMILVVTLLILTPSLVLWLPGLLMG
jgi:tripartite ATP-independent transporter DctM subunit